MVIFTGREARWRSQRVVPIGRSMALNCERPAEPARIVLLATSPYTAHLLLGTFDDGGRVIWQERSRTGPRRFPLVPNRRCDAVSSPTTLRHRHPWHAECPIVRRHPQAVKHAGEPGKVQRGRPMANSEMIRWTQDVAAAREQARQERKLVFVDIWSKT